MPGSRKGERRGGAKPGHFRKTAKPAKRGRGRPAGSPNKPKEKFAPELAALLNKKAPAARREQELEMYFTVVGRRGVRLPREVMLDAMKYFEETAIEYGDVLRANLEAAARADSPEARAIYSQAASGAENLLREYLTMAVDVAYKAAPYMHPRLAAFITKPGSDGAPADILALLLQDLDGAGKPPRYIDHDANEVAK